MRVFLLSLLLCLAATVSGAEQAVPDRHVALSRDLDFPGSDLQTILDTTFDACEAACLANGACVAFTYNQRSSSCFPKSAVGDTAPYRGALSGRVYPADPGVLASAPARAGDLSFLPDGLLADATALARTIGRLHSTDENAPADLIAAARQAATAGDPVAAARFTGAAVAVTDAADQWLDYARYALQAKGGGAAADLRQRAVPAAINGYLRARGDAARASALLDLSQTLEAAGDGRSMIPALRLAQSIAPRRDTEAALDAAIAKYGFRVQDTQVESDSATPRLCAVFTEDLVKAGVDYAPFVQLPDDRLTVEVDGPQLCVDGVEHGQSYRIVLREGLPAASGEALIRPVELTLYVRDRSPSVSFPSRAYVLPRLGDVAVPVRSVNLETADLTLRRMTDRNLVRTMQEGLFANPLYDWNQQNFDDQLGEVIWKGTATLGNELNRDMTTRLPLADALSGAPAGVYVLTAAVPGADPYDTPPATQWFVLSDLGIATILGTDGLTVNVRGLGDAAAVAGATVTLTSEGNEVLGTAVTDAEGTARFAAGLTRGVGAAAPALVTASLDGDTAFVSLRDPAFDLSDRGVEGREPAGPIDVFLSTDRGAYRAGETIHLTALMRDASAAALPGVPLTLVATRPDGVEYSRIVSTGDVAGGHVFALPIGATAPRGTWRLAVRTDPEGPALAATSVLVEDFLPERIDFDLALPATIRVGDTPELQIAARYLFGARGADLAIEGEALLRATDTIDAFPGYRFGRYDALAAAQLSTLDGGRTDGEGNASVPVTLPDIAAEGRPLDLRVTARLSEGSGRPVERQVSAPVRPDGPLIGIRPAADGPVPEGGTARFALIGLAPDLSPQPMQVKWTLNRVTTRYSWYSLYGSWNWEPVTTRERIATGSADLAGQLVEVSAAVDWGRYELIVERTDGPYVASSVDFTAGWYAPANAATTPDLLEASLDKPAYAVGDTAQFRIVPRYAGTAVVSVVTNHVIHMEAVPVPEGETVIPLPVTEEWGAGAYVTATVIRPMDLAAGHNPARALGLSYAPVDPGDKALSVRIDAPESVRPRGPLSATLHVDGAAPGDTAYVTLAAVDVGILNLTGFQAPDPQGYFFGQRKLGVELRDIYGQLIDGLNGALGTVRSGGDAMAQMRMQSPPPTEDLVAFFDGPVPVGPDGTATVAFDLPAFNGTVRLMAVAWSARGVGQAARDVLVRDPVVVTASVPRFLTPGDQSRLRLDLVHVDGPAGEMPLTVTASGLTLDPASVPAPVTLAPGGRQTLSLPITAGAVGDGTITVTLTTPDGTALTRTLTVPVEVTDPAISRQSRLTLAPGDTFVFDSNVFAGLVPGSGEATLSVGPLARFDAPGLLATLDRYPYGCTEQVTSQALPLLYFDQVAQAMGLAGPDAGARIDKAIQAVLANQDSNGAFGLWGPASGDLWLDAYVTDFLSRARAAGHAVPDRAFTSALDNLRNRVNYAPDFDSGGQDLAYALMVLAREGAAAVGDLRYYADVKAGAFSTPLASAQLGAALAYYGDQTRADTLIAQAGRQLQTAFAAPEDPVWRIDYGSDRRDAAAVLALAVEAGSDVLNRDDLSARLARAGEAVSTQEAAWTLLAAHALIGDVAASGITVDGTAPTGPLVRVLAQDTDAGPVRIANTGPDAADLTVTTFGVPAEPEPAGGTGWQIERAYFDMDGAPVDPARVAQGTRLVTVLTVTPFGRQEARLMVSDPLPAGFEIDNPNLIRGGELSALPWLDPVADAHAEFRSDRFLAAVDWQSDKAFRLAYIVRAVSPGAFHHPAASVEDMYRPVQRARTAAGAVTVTE